MTDPSWILEIHKLATKNPTVRACLMTYRMGEISLEGALASMVCLIAEQNEKLVNGAVAKARKECPPFQLGIPEQDREAELLTSEFNRTIGDIMNRQWIDAYRRL